MNAIVVPGKSLLKTSGILIIIAGGIGILISAIGLLGGVAATSMGVELIDEFGVDGQTMLLDSVVSFFVCGFQLFMGIFGLINCEKLEKANICMILGILAIVLAIANVFTESYMFGVLGILFPILYLQGALKNKKAAKTQVPAEV